MIPARPPLVRVLAAGLVLFGCGGTSVKHGDDPGGRAGMSGTGADGGTGGTAGHGGTAAGGGGRAGRGGTGGTGGDAGGGVCETGQACSVQGATCTLPEQCCPCVLTCLGEIWGPAFCPPCALECPATLPQTGDPCSICDVPSGCEWDLRTVDGPIYVGICRDDQWVVQPKGSMPMCCTDAAQCAPNLCVNGTCLPRIEEHCWSDDQCEKGELCSGGSVCGCGVVCGGPDRLGVCVPDGLDCCRDDSSCDVGEECVAGVCKERTPGGCWRDQDCTTPGAACTAPTVCPCGTSCPVGDEPGRCVIPL
jgi:hypothetical protein